MDKNIFKERLIYEKYKDRPIDDFKRFKQQIKDKHGFEPSDELIRKLKIYQRKKSEMQPYRQFNKFFHENTPHNRIKQNGLKSERKTAKRNLERIERDGEKRDDYCGGKI